MGMKQIFEKQGGMKLIKQYWQGGAFFTAVGEFILLGKSRTALEILRLSTQLKTKKKLYKRYNWVLDEFEKNYNNNVSHEVSNKVWICWFQGIDQAPALVQKCYQSVKKNMADKDVILLTTENMFDYIQLPPFIVEKWKTGVITHTHMTDLMRLELLIRYGGLWLDATVFCSDSRIPSYFYQSDLFMYQCLKPGRDGHANYISSWLMSAKTNSKVLMAVQDLCYAYWKENNSMWDYFLLHDFIAIVLDRFQEDARTIIPRDNATPHILLLRLFDKFDEETWNAIKSQTQFHKLTYKFTEEQRQRKGTYYDVLFRGE